MCGRFALFSDPRVLRDRFDLVEVVEYRPSYNIAPSEFTPIAAVTQKKDGRHLSLYRWGLVPTWVKELPKHLFINARAETIDQKPSFKGPFKYHRCLIPADGYYEWQKVGKAKQPWYIHAADGQPLAFAGLFDVWLAPTGDELHSATIITTDAGARTQHIHDRMPVVLRPEDWNAWLSPATPKEDLLGLLRPTAEDLLDCHRVSMSVNTAEHDDSTCIEAIG
jgi:putative SOS response-associated peptidase YedK